MAELLLARCPNVDKVKEVAAELGVTETRFPKKNEDCILCGLCTRVCSELMKSGAIDFRGRGSTREVAPAYDKHSPICMACGACAIVCPTGAVDLSEVSSRPPRPVTSAYDAGLVQRPSIYIPYQQAIPKVPVIDRDTCMHFLKGEELDACRACETACSAKAIDYTQEDEIVDLDVGAAILSPGSCLFDANQKLELGYSWAPNVLTSLQFERLQSASGPYEGQILRVSDGEHPHRIAFIQCVGSRDYEHNYCSSVCCMYATKEAIIAKEHEPDLECTIFYMDMRAYGKGFDAYFERAKEMGVRYVRCRPSHVEEMPGTQNLKIHYEAEDGTHQTEEFDMVILSVGLQPPQDAQLLAGRFGIELDENGFARTAPTSPVSTSRDGVYVCGPFAEPKDIPETVMEASAAAAKAMALLAEKRGTEIIEREYPPEKDVSGQPPRIGVFVCHCGKNIGGVVDVPSVAEYAQSLPGVVYAEDNLYTCSSDTQARIREHIEEYDLNRVVVASCTPRTHEPLFQNTVREAGLNPYLFEMANIRDQCSWMHMHQPAEATVKAKDLVRMAVAKARLLEPLQIGEISINNDALVIGGGMS
ncbi:FAD-dependent oxidoreductase, partial [Candidatus Bipolaricaulota bacterium]|nr:FAD-dependent oxidoreductase [Candidatus Bipolaricaulota bacterium]